jgi:hypothetical protein
MLVSPKLVTGSLFLCLSNALMLAQTLPTPAVLPAETQQYVEKVKGCRTGPVVIKDDPHTCHTLAERMTELSQHSRYSQRSDRLGARLRGSAGGRQASEC